jgi:hypothetical protein
MGLVSLQRNLLLQFLARLQAESDGVPGFAEAGSTPDTGAAALAGVIDKLKAGAALDAVETDALEDIVRTARPTLPI